MTRSRPDARLLLVGSTGRAGRLISKAWTRYPPGARTVIQVRDCAEANTPGQLRWAPLESTEPLRDWVSHYGAIDAMIVMAGVIPASGGNLEDNGTIAEACVAGALDANIRRVLIASSSSVYGSWKSTPYSEEDETRPVNPYGVAKVDMERAALSLSADKVEVTNLRIGNIAGADALLLNLANAGSGRPLNIHRFANDRGPFRSYIGPVSLAASLVRLALHRGPLPPILNVAAQSAVHMEDLAEAGSIPWRFIPAPPHAHQNIVLNTAKLARIAPMPHGAWKPKAIIGEWAGLGMTDVPS